MKKKINTHKETKILQEGQLTAGLKSQLVRAKSNTNTTTKGTKSKTKKKDTSENEPDENEPDEDEPDENEKDES